MLVHARIFHSRQCCCNLYLIHRAEPQKETSLSCRRETARRYASRPPCCKQRRALSVINLRRLNVVNNTYERRRAVTKNQKNGSV